MTQNAQAPGPGCGRLGDVCPEAMQFLFSVVPPVGRTHPQVHQPLTWGDGLRLGVIRDPWGQPLAEALAVVTTAVLALSGCGVTTPGGHWVGGEWRDSRTRW